jgi:hypothetical protein
MLLQISKSISFIQACCMDLFLSIGTIWRKETPAETNRDSPSNILNSTNAMSPEVILIHLNPRIPALLPSHSFRHPVATRIYFKDTSYTGKGKRR